MKYNSKYCIMGMMSKNSKPFCNWKGFVKNKNNAVSFDANFKPDYPKINYSYIYERPNIKGSYSGTQVVSSLGDDFFNLVGKKYREIRETRNKFNKELRIGEYDQKKVMDLIDKWDEIAGKKYGWQRHSGYDRNFFMAWFPKERENLFSRFYYLGNVLVGYSILHKGRESFEYIIRKADNTIRNTCLYVDYKTFEEIYKDNGKFLVNWGSSSGGVLKYKRKFPVFEEKKVWFYKVKKQLKGL